MEILVLAICLIEPPQTTFKDVEAEAVRLNKPVLVFQDCSPIPGPWLGWITKTRESDPLIIINVVRDGKLVFRAWVSPGLGAEQIIWNVLK